MATFPSLVPSAAPVTPGAWPVSAINSLNGAESRIRQGSAQIGRRLRLTFSNITEANFLALLAHYQGQRSGFDPFGFDTTTLAADLTPSGHAWLYASRPQVVDEHLDVFTVVCEFKSEPRGLVVAAGRCWRTGAATLVAGAASDGTRVAAGKQLATTSTTLAPGARSSGVGSNGVAWAASSTTFRPGTTSDPYFSSVSLLLHMNGSNGSTAFVDSSSNALASTATNATISTSQSRFGGASGSFNGSTTYLTVNPGGSSPFNLGTGDFTVELFAFISSSQPESFPIIFSHGSGTANYGIIVDTTLTNLSFFYGSARQYMALGGFAYDTWMHLAISRSGTTLKVFANGVVQSSQTMSAQLGNSSAMTIGAEVGGSLNKFKGYVDELRVTSPGVARYTAGFSPPSAQFPDY